MLAEAQGRYSPATKAHMHQYDFTFGAWPVDFDVRQQEGDGSKPAPLHTGPGGAWWPLDMLGTVTFLYLNVNISCSLAPDAQLRHLAGLPGEHRHHGHVGGEAAPGGQDQAAAGRRQQEQGRHQGRQPDRHHVLAAEEQVRG